jgi:hypothetical protein
MINIKETYQDDSKGSVAEVVIGEEVVEVKFWYSYTSQLQNEQELEAYLIAEAQKKLGNIQVAKDVLNVFASGVNETTEQEAEVNGITFTQYFNNDTRNWAKIWIDAN